MSDHIESKDSKVISQVSFSYITVVSTLDLVLNLLLKLLLGIDMLIVQPL